ncbi:hypothetical protein H5P28_08155 [Ruficoccus amylovorans]|uniref:Uncharacterized protein n=1 Tax=Ruficoccus amylovorans TaxID=1804625 RepID=A0A842HFE2_9BACT|nr:hypothetical protein [Ruficoccus amylovorans]MBC2594234.1 hypothetical protein [Ruficoccus amylovorans]
MPAESVQLEALVLGREQTGENHLRFSLLDPESGRREAFYRQTQAGKGTPPDLFDRGEFHLEAARSGNAWFVREFRLRQRLSGISRHYANFQAAAEWALFLRHNAVHCHMPATVFDIAQKTFSALENTAQPEAALLKGFYLFARQEGWPVREEWLRNLPTTERDSAAHILNSPLEVLAASPETARRLARTLKNWLAARDEVRLS